MKRSLLLCSILMLCVTLNSCMLMYTQYFKLFAQTDGLQDPSYGIIAPKNLDSVRLADKVDVKALALKYPGEKGVYLSFDESVESLGRNFPLYDVSAMCRHIRYVVLDPDEKPLTTFECSVRKETDLLDVYIIMVSVDGKIQMWRKDDLTKQQSDEGTMFRLAYPNVQKGTVIEEAIMITNMGNTTTFLQHRLPVQNMYFKHVYNPKTEILVRKSSMLNSSDFKTDNVLGTPLKVKSLELHDVPSWHDEPYSPYHKEVCAFYQFNQYTRPSSVVVTPFNWSSFGEDRPDCWRDLDKNSSRKVNDFAKNLCKNCRSKKDIVDTVTVWMQQHIESVGASDSRYSRAFRTTDFEDIIDQGYGVVSGVLSLAQCMLVVNGVETATVLICDRRDGEFDESHPEFASFSGIGLLSRDGESKTYLTFPHIKEIPSSYVPEVYQGARALLIGAFVSLSTTESYKNRSFITLNSENMSPSTEINDFSLEIGEDGLIHVKEKQTYQGSEAYGLRTEFKTMKEDEIAQRVRKMLSYSGGDVKVEKYTVDGKNSALVPFVMQAEYTINNLVTVTPEESIFQTAGLFSNSSDTHSSLETDNRINPIDISYSSQHLTHINVKYPSTWTLSSSVKDVHIDNELGSASVKYTTAQPAVLGVEIERSLKRTRLPKEKLGELIEIAGRQSAVQIPNLIFKSK